MIPPATGNDLSRDFSLEELALHATSLTLGQANNKDIGHPDHPFLTDGSWRERNLAAQELRWTQSLVQSSGLVVSEPDHEG